MFFFYFRRSLKQPPSFESFYKIQAILIFASRFCSISDVGQFVNRKRFEQLLLGYTHHNVMQNPAGVFVIKFRISIAKIYNDDAQMFKGFPSKIILLMIFLPISKYHEY